jgi:anti-anti-sigma factor
MDGTGDVLAEEPGFRAEANRDGSNSAIVRLRGELDIASAGAARRALEQLDTGIQQIVLDLSHITFCDAAGVRFLLTAQRQARTAGRELVVRHPSRPVRRVLTITGELSAIYPADPPTYKEPTTGSPAPPSHGEFITYPKRTAGVPRTAARNVLAFFPHGAQAQLRRMQTLERRVAGTRRRHLAHAYRPSGLADLAAASDIPAIC